MSKTPKKIDGRANNGRHPNSIAVLKEHAAPPFEPGHSGNPEGRARRVASALEKALDKVHPKDKEQRKLIQIMCEGIIMKASRDASAFNAVADRIDGKVNQTISGPEGSSIPVKMTLGELDEQLRDLIGRIAAR